MYDIYVTIVYEIIIGKVLDEKTLRSLIRV